MKRITCKLAALACLPAALLTGGGIGIAQAQ